MMQVLTGRPIDLDKRKEKEIRSYDLLDALGIEYARVDHEAAETMAACKEVDEALDVRMCKNLFLCNRQKTNFYLLMMPGEKTFKTKELSGQINSARLSFASGEDMVKYLDIEPGSASVLGLMNDKENQVALLVDEDLLGSEYIGVHPCVNTSSLKIKTSDIFETFSEAIGHRATVVKLTGE